MADIYELLAKYAKVPARPPPLPAQRAKAMDILGRALPATPRANSAPHGGPAPQAPAAPAQPLPSISQAQAGAQTSASAKGRPALPALPVKPYAQSRTQAQLAAKPPAPPSQRPDAVYQAPHPMAGHNERVPENRPVARPRDQEPSIIVDPTLTQPRQWASWEAQRAQAQGQAAPQAPAPQAQDPAPQAQAPQAQAPAPQTQAAPQAQTTAMQHVDNALTRVRGAPQSAWNKLSPENQEYLRRGGQWAGRQATRGARWGALGLGTYTGYKMLTDSSGSEQDARMRDHLANAQHLMAQPMPDMSVYASYDDFAESKLARLQPMAMPGPFIVRTNDAFSSAFGQSLARKLVEEPIDNIHRFLKRKIVDDPKANDVFHTVISEDPMLAQSYRDNPKMLERSFAVMRKMSPSISTLHGPVQSYLRLAMMSGGNLDPAAVKHLTDIQQAHSRAKAGT